MGVVGSRDQFADFGTPRNFRTNRATSFKFGAEMEEGPSLHTDHKTTSKWAWPESRESIFKFWDPLITLEQIKLSLSLSLSLCFNGRFPGEPGLVDVF